MNPRRGLNENGSYFCAAQVASCENEHPCFAPTQCGDLQGTVPQLLILGQDDPASLTSGPQPHPILLCTRKMIIVNLDRKTAFDELRSDGFYPKRPVDEEYTPIRQLRSGLLLRSH